MGNNFDQINIIQLSNMKYSLAVAALLSIVTKNDVVNAINSKSTTDLETHN